jgi:hypothetical protein
MRRPDLPGAARWVVAAAGLLFGAAHADPIDLKPFKATYTVEWKGMNAGTSVLELRRAGTDTFTYVNTNTPHGVFRLALPDAIEQGSTFRLSNGQVLPLTFRGADEKERAIDLTFDWNRKRVTGTAKDKPVDLELVDGAQDPMSLQIASLRNLAAGKLQGTVWMIDGDKLKEFELRQEGNAQLETAVGKLDTIIYTSRRSSGDRVTRTWVAPALGYLPVRAERVRGKKTEFSIAIESVDK